MKAQFSQVRDLQRGEDGKDSLVDIRRVNTMAFMLFTNVPDQEVPIRMRNQSVSILPESYGYHSVTVALYHFPVFDARSEQYHSPDNVFYTSAAVVEDPADGRFPLRLAKQYARECPVIDKDSILPWWLGDDICRPLASTFQQEYFYPEQCTQKAIGGASADDGVVMFEAPQTLPGGWRFKGWYSPPSPSEDGSGDDVDRIGILGEANPDTYSIRGVVYARGSFKFSDLPALSSFTKPFWGTGAARATRQIYLSSLMNDTQTLPASFIRYHWSAFLKPSYDSSNPTSVGHEYFPFGQFPPGANHICDKDQERIFSKLVDVNHNELSWPDDETWVPDNSDVERVYKELYVSSARQWTCGDHGEHATSGVWPTSYTHGVFYPNGFWGLPQWGYSDKNAIPNIMEGGEGVCLCFNFLMAKYEKDDEPIYFVNPSDGQTQAVTVEGQYDPIEDGGTVAVGDLGAWASYVRSLVLANHGWGDDEARRLTLDNLWRGSGSLYPGVRPEDDPVLTEVWSGIYGVLESRVPYRTSLWAQWVQTFNLRVESGFPGRARYRYSQRGRTIDDVWMPSDVTASFLLSSRDEMAIVFDMIGGKGSWIPDRTIYSGSQVVSYGWEDTVRQGATSYYKARIREGETPASTDREVMEDNPLRIPFQFEPIVTPYIYAAARIPVQTDSYVQEVFWSIDDGVEVEASLNASGIAWIPYVLIGQKVKVWGTAADSSISLNATREHPLTFTPLGGSEVVHFYFYVCRSAPRVQEVVFDALFVWTAYMATASAVSGTLTKKTNNVYSGYIENPDYGYGIILQAGASSDAATAYGADRYSVDVTEATEYVLAVDTVWTSNSDVWDTGTTLEHWSARVVFLTAGGTIISVDGAEVSYALTADGVHSGIVRFTTPAGAVGAQIVFSVQAGYRADFCNVQFCTGWTYDHCGIARNAGPHNSQFDEVPRRWLSGETSAEYGSRYPLPVASRSGHVFLWWVTSDGIKVGADTPLLTMTDPTTGEVRVRPNVVLYSVWRTGEVEVTFNPQGGRFATVSDFLALKQYGQPYGTLPTPVRAGYTFMGWWTLPEGGSQVSSTDIMDSEEPVTLFAHWVVESVKYDLRFNAVGGLITSGGHQVYSLVRELAPGALYGTLPEATKENMVLLGWFTEAHGGTLVSATDVMEAGDKVVYAHWGVKVVNIYFNAAGGTLVDPVRSVIAGAALGTLPKPSKTGGIFDGWFTSPEGGKQITESSVVTADTSFYAHWHDGSAGALLNVQYKINLVTNGGTVDSGYKAKYVLGYGKALPTAQQVTKTGATFDGWYASADFSGSPVTKIPNTAKGTKTFYAKWL